MVAPARYPQECMACRFLPGCRPPSERVVTPRPCCPNLKDRSWEAGGSDDLVDDGIAE